MRKLICLVVAVSLLFSCSTISFAAIDETENLTEQQIVDKIEEAKAETFADIYLQLEEQGRTDHMDEYIEILSSEIEQSIRQKYDKKLKDAEILANGAYIPYGGTVSYTSTLDAKVLKTYMDYDNTYYYVLSENYVVAKLVIETILGYIPDWSNVFTVLAGLKTICSSSSLSSVRNASGYGYILSIQAYDGSRSTVLLGWTNYPYAAAVSDASSTVLTKVFSKHNPFN